MQSSRTLGMAFALLTTGVGTMQASHADAAPAPTTTPTPSALSGLVIHEGVAYSWQGPGKSSEYHKVEYKEKPLLKEEKPALTFLDPTKTFIQPGESDASSDSPRLSLDLQSGEGLPHGGFFDALKLDPFKFHPGMLGPCRVVGRFTTDFDSRETRLTLGVEAPSFRLSSIGVGNGTNLSNYLIPGIALDQRWKGSNNGQQTVGILTYRGFVGKTFGWAYDIPMAFTEEGITAAGQPAESFKSLEAWQKAHLADTDLAKDEKKAFLFSLYGFVKPADFGGSFGTTNGYGDPNDPVKYAAAVHDIYRKYAYAHRLRPVGTVGLTYQGWYNFKDDPLQKRFNHGVALSATQRFHLGKSDRISFVEVLVNVGRDYGNPTSPKRLVGLNTGLEF